MSTNSVLKVLGKDFVIYGISSAAGKFIALFLVPIYTRIFSPETYGIMDMIATVIAICTIFGMMQLESAVSRYFYAEKNEYNRNILVSTALWSILALSILFVIVITFCSGLISSLLFHSYSYSSLIIIACLSIPVANLNSLFTVVIRFKKKPLHYMFFQLVQILSSVGLAIFFVVYQKIGIVGVFLAEIIGYSLSTIMMVFYLKSQLLFAWSLEELKKMMRYSLPLVPSVAGGWINSYISRFVMLSYLSVAEIGIYAVALKVASLFQLIGGALRMAWAPFFWETYENNPNHKVVFKKAQALISTGVFAFVIFIILTSDMLVNLLATKQYTQAIPLVGVLSMAIALDNIIIPITGIGSGIMKRTELNTLIYFLSIPVNISMLFLLVPKLGIIGVPISLLVANTVFLLLAWYNSERLYYVGFKKIEMFFKITLTLTILFTTIYFDLTNAVKMIIGISILACLLLYYRSNILTLYKNKQFLNI